MTPSTAPKGLKFRRMLVDMVEVGVAKRRRSRIRYDIPVTVVRYLKDRLIDPPRYQGTLTDRELGSWRVSAKLTLELADQTHKEVDWKAVAQHSRTFWGVSAGRLPVFEDLVRKHARLVLNGEHLKMKAGDLLRLLDAVEGR